MDRMFYNQSNLGNAFNRCPHNKKPGGKLIHQRNNESGKLIRQRVVKKFIDVYRYPNCMSLLPFIMPENETFSGMMICFGHKIRIVGYIPLLAMRILLYNIFSVTNSTLLTINVLLN